MTLFESDELEWWQRVTWTLGILFLLAWLLVFSGLGLFSIYIHGMVIPIFGLLSVPITVWGVIRSIFNPPIWRMERLFGLLILMVVGYFGSTHLFAAPVETKNFESSTDYRLPFDGKWYTLSGGESLRRNHHASTAAYRWGYDFTILKNGRRFTGNKNHVEDYYCYGQPILAPANGKVVSIEKGHPDKDPDNMNYQSILGNHLVIKTAPNEYLFLAHLQQGSIQHQKGDKIDRGAVIGECGNSGRTIKPHLHIHLQNSSSFPWAIGLPLRFSDYRTSSGLVSKGIPAGQTNRKKRDGTFVESQR